MALADDLRGLADRSLAALNEAHDYFTFSKRIWRLLREDVEEGRKFKFLNQTTGKVLNQKGLADLASLYVPDYLSAFSFQHFVALFEAFFFDLLRLWLAAYPGSLAKKQVEFGMVLQAPDKTALTFAVVDRELNELKYERVAKWFAYLEGLTKLECPCARQAWGRRIGCNEYS